MIFDSKPSIVGHRGFGAGNPGGYRENTVASFLAAVACGLIWVELDVHRSRDGELMVCHEPVAPSGGAIVTRTAADLGADGVATLAEVLTALPADVAVNIDVKTIINDAVDPPVHRTHARVADVLREQHRTRRFLVSSFDPSVVVYLAARRDAIGEAALGLIAGPGLPARHAIPAAANLGLDAVCLHTDVLHGRGQHSGPAVLSRKRIVQTAHQAGLEVLTWSPGPDDAVQLAADGVDAVCVNDIPGVQAALAAAIGSRD
jgi:glycerophosphoryl diester phosphodiesterase